jgi:hypothetical protein
MTIAIPDQPILFRPDMVAAILRDENPKTQTRRLIKPQPEQQGEVHRRPAWYWNGGAALRRIGHECGYVHTNWSALERILLEASRFKVGGKLWVRETWQAYAPQTKRFGGTGVLAGASMRVFARKPIQGESLIEYRADHLSDNGQVWRSSLHLPRWASRLTLEITDVRVEWLQDISEEDAKAEGVERIVTRIVKPGSVPIEYMTLTHSDYFADLWDKINPKHPWAANPLVLAISFRKAE